MNDNKIIYKVQSLLLDDSFLKLKEIYYKKTIFDILGKTRDEKTHSKIIAWLLNSNISGHEKFLISFLRLLIIESNEKDILPKDISEKIIVDSKSLRLECESQALEYYISSESILDIYMVLKIDDLDVSLIIENKVDSKENNDQTLRYFNQIKEDHHKIFVYLTIDKEIAKSKEFINISYQELVSYIIEPNLRFINDINEKFFISDYLHSLEQNLELKKGRKKGVMAVRDETRNLMKKLFEDNKEIFMAIIRYVADDEDDEKIKKKMNELVNKLQEKDFTKYTMDGQKNLAKSRLVLNAIKKYVIENDPKGEDLKNKFNHLGHPLDVIFESNKELKGDKKRRYYTKDDEVIKIGGSTFYVTNQWSKGEVFDKFLMLAREDLGYNISET